MINRLEKNVDDKEKKADDDHEIKQMTLIMEGLVVMIA